MNDYDRENTQSESREQINQKVLEFQNKVSGGLNKTMSSTAEYLDKTAEKFHKTAEFFRDKNTDSLKEDISDFTKKYPAQTLLGAMVVGFLFGKLISK